MAKFQFNQPLKLINKKPKGENMTNNGYGFYMYPSLVIEYINDNTVLTDRERRLYLAISGQAEKDNQGKPCKWSIKHYCKIAHIGNNHYAEVLDSLCKKGFIIHNNFESIEVLYPISQNEVISSNGKIIKRENFPNSKSEKIFPPNQEEKQDKKGNNESHFGNKYSQIMANNKEINENTNNCNKDKEWEASQKWEALPPPQTPHISLADFL